MTIRQKKMLKSNRKKSPILNKPVATKKQVKKKFARTKKASEMLEQHPEFNLDFYSLAEASSSSILIYWEKGIHYANTAAFELTGYSKAELLKMHFLNIIYPDDRKGMKNNLIPQPSEKNISFRNEIRILTKTDEVRWIEFAVKRIDYDGESAAMSMATDISEKKFAEQKIRENQEGYRTLFEGANDAIFIMQGGLFISCNEKTLQIFKCRSENIIGKSPIDYSPPLQPDGRPSKESAAEKIKNAYMGFPQYFEWKHIHFDGTPFDAEVGLNKIEVQGKPYLQAIVRDITERKKAEEVIRQSEKQFRTIFESAPIGKCLVGTDGLFIKVNQSLCDMLGYTQEELLNKSFEEFTHPDDRAKSNAWVQKLLQGKNVPSFIEKRYVHKNGNSIWGHVSTAIFKDFTGKAKYFITQILDITERIHEEKTRQLNAERLEALIRLNNLTDKSIEELSDYALEEVVKLTGSMFGYLAFMNDDESIIMLHAWSSEVMNICKVKGSYHQFIVKETGLLGEPVRVRKPVITNNYTAKNPLKHGFPEGHVPITKHMNVPIIDNGKIVILAGAANKESDYDETDINQLTLLMNGMWRLIQRKKADEALKESEERYRIIADNSNDIIVKYGTNGRISFVSPACKFMLGYEIKDMLKHSVFEFFHPEDVPYLRQYQAKLLNQKAPNLIKHRLRRKDDEYLWCETNNQIIHETDGSIKEVVAVIRDISDLLKSEKLIKEKEAAEFANKAKSEFLANMSHEIRNPLNSIIGLSNSLGRINLSDEQRNIVESLKISSNNLLNILNDILDFSKIEANKIDVQNNHFNIREVISDVYSSGKDAADFKNLTYTITIDDNIPEYLFGDSVKLKQILINLTGNAIKFTDSGNITVNAKETKREPDQTILHFDIKDSGIGIKEEDFSKLFQSFTQLDSSTTKSHSGTGLGLAIVKRYIELLNGTVGLESKYKKGSTFFIDIPFRISEKQTVEKHSEHKDTGVSDSKPLILLAEDDGINQLYLKGFLNKIGYAVDTAFNGLQALEKYDQKNYNIILMDGQMPKMDGFEATRRIREKEKQSKKHSVIIAITGYAVSGDKEKFISAGMDDYVSKPIDENLLVELLQKYSGKITK